MILMYFVAFINVLSYSINTALTEPVQKYHRSFFEYPLFSMFEEFFYGRIIFI